jgi:hypothetical protein
MQAVNGLAKPGRSAGLRERRRRHKGANMAMVKKGVQKKKKVSHMKMGKADVQLHLQPQTGRMQIILTFPAKISKILARRLDKRINP